VIVWLPANDNVSRTERHLYLAAITTSTSRRFITGDPVHTSVIMIASELVLILARLIH
jgi:hypothetical protein